jgi:hypothetical protein
MYPIWGKRVPGDRGQEILEKAADNGDIVYIKRTPNSEPIPVRVYPSDSESVLWYLQEVPS